MTNELINILSTGKLTIEQANALDILKSKKVPASEIDQRPGPGGRKLHYIKHTYATRLMQDGMGPFWSFEVLNWEVYHDTLYKWVKKPAKDGEKAKKIKQPFEQRSIAARCRLTITYPHPESGEFLKQPFTEIGAFEPNEGMSTANGIASAVSRGLCKCLMRALGIGLELYEDENQAEITPKKAWNILKRYLVARGIEWNKDFEEELLAALKEKGIVEKKDFVEKFTLAYEIANEFLDTDEEIPM